MKVKLNISAHHVEGALIRILGTIERRGHRLLDLRCRVSNPAQAIQTLQIEVECGERSPGILVRQLERLHDTVSVHCHAPSEAVNKNHHLNDHSTLPQAAERSDTVRRATHG